MAENDTAAEESPELGPVEAVAATQSAGSSERILNQEEIDSLLGFDASTDQLQDKAGVRAIINSALVSYERLPMLEIVFDRLVRLMTTSLRNFTSDNVEVSLDSITSIRFGDYLNSIPLPAILAVFRAEQLYNYGLFTVDSNLIYSIVDVLLGGRRGSSSRVLQCTTAPTRRRSWTRCRGCEAAPRLQATCRARLSSACSCSNRRSSSNPRSPTTFTCRSTIRLSFTGLGGRRLIGRGSGTRRPFMDIRLRAE